MDKLSAEEIESRLEGLPEWAVSGSTVQRTFMLPSFEEAVDFVNRIAALAERVGHHPDIMIRYNKVTLSLTTHDAGGLTDRDFDLAAATDAEMARI